MYVVCIVLPMTTISYIPVVLVSSYLRYLYNYKRATWKIIEPFRIHHILRYQITIFWRCYILVFWHHTKISEVLIFCYSERQATIVWTMRTIKVIDSNQIILTEMTIFHHERALVKDSLLNNCHRRRLPLDWCISFLVSK